MVIGGTGLVGNALVRHWESKGETVAMATYRSHPGMGFHQLDMTDEKATREAIARIKPELVAVPAANPFVDYCEAHPEETRRTNVTGTLNVARACKDAGARMIFFSSDYVFDGKKEEYTETDTPNPINEYGRQKAQTEEGVLKLDAGNVVVRTSGAYGWQWEPKNFVLQIKTRLEAGQPMKVAKGLSYNPTAVENLAEVVASLRDGGIYHVVGAERIDRVAFAGRAAEAFGLDSSLIMPIDFVSPTPRPKSSSLSTAKVRAAVRIPLWDVETGLRRMKEQRESWRRYAAEKLPPVPA